MDAGPLPLRLIRAAVPAALLLAGGCGGAGPAPPAREEVGRKLRKEIEKARPASVAFQGTKGNEFTVDDENGRPLIQARVEEFGGAVRPGTGLQGPVRMRRARCRLFTAGKPSLDLEAPEATWDGRALRAEKGAHAVTVDGGTVIDARQATWTADTGALDLLDARLQGIRGGRPEFTAEGPEARVEAGVVLLPSGATARGEGGTGLRARRVRWELRSARLEATGAVTVTSAAAGTTVTGSRLLADTRLQRGRFTGATRVRIRRDPDGPAGGGGRGASRGPGGSAPEGAEGRGA